MAKKLIDIASVLPHILNANDADIKFNPISMLKLFSVTGPLNFVEQSIGYFYEKNVDITVVSTSLTVIPYQYADDKYTSMIHYKSH